MARSLLIVAFLASPLAADPTPLSPNDAVQRMKLPPGFSIRCVAHEPLVQQPISMSFDHRGRLWVLQYLQYPEPAGLVAVKRDQFLRTTWDRVPEPPPQGPRGADKLTILHDPDEHGVFTKSTDVITGLNLASGFCLTNTGVYVLQAPYLLYYSLAGDNVMGDPKVVLTGFGNEDSHALANSLQFGPDGWLYGAQGSTVTAKIKNPAKPNDPPIEFQQGIWRYHPDRKIFELFAEGGGNIWGLDFDKHGQLFAGTNFGGVAMMHVVQGGYYVKNFAKHGPLHNPYAYGYYEHVPYKNFKGGHVTCGGIIYQGGAYPKEYEDQYIACNPLANDIYWHKLTPAGSSFTAEHGGELVKGNDPWFRPIDLETGPDGCVYVADWYDKRLNHVDPVDNWHKTSGRIYRIEYGEYKPVKPFNLATHETEELLDLLKHPNSWWRRAARQRLASELHKNAKDGLLKLVISENDQLALESLWAGYTCGFIEMREFRLKDGEDPLEHAKLFNADPLYTLMRSKNENLRAWALRVGFDAYTPEKQRMISKLTLDAEEASPTVRLQAASIAKRIFGVDGSGMLFQAIRRDVPKDDQLLPLMIWWSFSNHDYLTLHLASVAHARELNHLDEFLLEKCARYDTHRQPVIFSMFTKSDSKWLNEPYLSAALRGVLAAHHDKAGTPLPAKEVSVLIDLRLKYPKNELIRSLLLRYGDGTAIAEVQRLIADKEAPENERLGAIRDSASINSATTLVILLKQLESPQPSKVEIAIINAIAKYDDQHLSQNLAAYVLKGTQRATAIYTMSTRKTWAIALVDLLQKKKIKPVDMAADVVSNLKAYNDSFINDVLTEHFGKLGPATAGEKQARIASVSKIVREGAGDAVAGKALFKTQCGTCHKLHGEGESIGPELTGFDRQNLQSLLLNVVDPSAVVRPEYVQQKAVLSDGRVLLGIVVEQQGAGIVLVDAQNRKHTIPRGDLEKLTPLDTSLMPEKLLDTLTDQQLRDLFKYLQSNTK